MNIRVLNSLFIWMTIIGAVFTAVGIFRSWRTGKTSTLTTIIAVLAAVGAIGSWSTGVKITQEKDREISNLSKNIVELRSRRITKEQRIKLVESLSKKRWKIGFVSKIFDTESENLANELMMIFQEAGWQTIQPINKTLLDDFDKELNIFAKPELKEYADLIVISLNEAGLSIWPQPIRDGAVSGVFDKGAVYIAISSKK